MNSHGKVRGHDGQNVIPDSDETSADVTDQDSDASPRRVKNIKKQKVHNTRSYTVQQQLQRIKKKIKKAQSKPKIEQVCKRSAVRRLARRGGAKRISGILYEEVRGIMEKFVTGLVKDSEAYMECGKRHTVTAMDVIYALRKRGRHLYGYS